MSIDAFKKAITEGRGKDENGKAFGLAFKKASLSTSQQGELLTLAIKEGQEEKAIIIASNMDMIFTTDVEPEAIVSAINQSMTGLLQTLYDDKSRLIGFRNEKFFAAAVEADQKDIAGSIGIGASLFKMHDEVNAMESAAEKGWVHVISDATANGTGWEYSNMDDLIISALANASPADLNKYELLEPIQSLGQGLKEPDEQLAIINAYAKEHGDTIQKALEGENGERFQKALDRALIEALKEEKNYGIKREKSRGVEGKERRLSRATAAGDTTINVQNTLLDLGAKFDLRNNDIMSTIVGTSPGSVTKNVRIIDIVARDNSPEKDKLLDRLRKKAEKLSSGDNPARAEPINTLLSQIQELSDEIANAPEPTEPTRPTREA